MKKIIYQKKNYSVKNKVNVDLTDFLYLTGGDPASISPEIIRKSLEKLGNELKDLRILYFFNASSEEKEKLLLQLKSWDIYFLKKWDMKEFLVVRELKDTKKNLLILFELGNYNPLIPSLHSAKLSYLALQKAIEFFKKYNGKGMVTAPISKHWVGKIDKKFTGHTGYLSKQFSKEVIMIMYSDYLSVVPLTEHIPISQVPRLLKKRLESLELFQIILKLYKNNLFETPWAFSGLNPHAGDNGHIGKEEKEFIIPFIKKLKRNHIDIEGPLSADSLFIPENLQKYKLFFCCYHDQALIPFKSLTGKEGINITYGLPFIRTSPAHGTAYDIAFKDIADPTSMYYALKFHYTKQFFKN